MKHPQQKAYLPPVFSLPLDRLEAMSDGELQELAGEARVSIAKMREILAKTRTRREACEAEKARMADNERKLRHIPHRIRSLICMMELTDERKRAIESLEKEAYAALDKGHEAVFVEKMSAAKTLMLKGAFFTLCLTQDVEKALAALHQVSTEEAQRFSNFPGLTSAMRRVSQVLENVAFSTDTGDRNGLPIDGPALVYSVNVPLNFPRHPRPRRFNDELDRF